MTLRFRQGGGRILRFVSRGLVILAISPWIYNEQGAAMGLMRPCIKKHPTRCSCGAFYWFSTFSDNERFSYRRSGWLLGDKQLKRKILLNATMWSASWAVLMSNGDGKKRKSTIYYGKWKSEVPRKCVQSKVRNHSRVRIDRGVRPSFWEISRE